MKIDIKVIKLQKGMEQLLVLTLWWLLSNISLIENKDITSISDIYMY